MALEFATKRLVKEHLALQNEPIENILAVPLDSNILEWHYVIFGTIDTPYEGGYYHGQLIFPSEYPMKPPSIRMSTPNGRFRTNKRICFSMSDYHPKTWSPAWCVRSILLGVYSFMLDNCHTVGSIITSEEQKRSFAADSLRFNCENPQFCECFPELVLKYSTLKEEYASPPSTLNVQSMSQATKVDAIRSPKKEIENYQGRKIQMETTKVELYQRFIETDDEMEIKNIFHLL